MILLDTGAAKALASGQRALNLLAGNIAATPADRLVVPALCLMQAEIDDAGTADRLLGYSAVVVEELSTVPAATVATLIRDGYGGPDTCHALYCAMPRAESDAMSIVLTTDEARYPPGVIAVDVESPGMLGFT